MIRALLWKHKIFIVIILLFLSFLGLFLIIATSKPQETEFVYQIN